MDNTNLLCGLDEAGRGPLAGPVVAASVILNDDFPVELLNDSKKLSEKKRFMLEELIKEKALAWGVSGATHEEIDEINILQASLLAMQRAFVQMQKMIDEKPSVKEFLRNKKIVAMVDGNFCPEIPIECFAEPKADGKYPSVMAASILAKTERDRLMCQYAVLYPEYGYEKHKGYPTVAHREICKKIGPSAIQRRTFKY